MAMTPAKQAEGLAVGTPEVIGSYNDGINTYPMYRKVIDGGTLNLALDGSIYTYKAQLNTPNIHGILSANVVIASAVFWQPLPYPYRSISYNLSDTVLQIVSTDSSAPTSYNGRKVIATIVYY